MDLRKSDITWQLVGGPAHSFLSFFLFWWEADDNFLFWPDARNWTDQHQTAAKFLTPWKSPPPHDCEIAFSFQRPWLLNLLISDRQCTYFSIVCALTISNFCFCCSCYHSYKKILFSERLSTMRTMKTSSCSLCMPFHNTAMALCQCRGNCHHAHFLPRSLRRTLLCWEGRGDDDDDDDDPRDN